MMIRINLLPVRAVKKREDGKQFLALVAVAVLAVAVGNYLWYSDREEARAKAQQRLADTQAKIAEKVQQIGEVDRINARRTEVQQKLDVLTQLKSRRAGPVKLMDALSTSMPEKVWLKDFVDTSGNIRVSGAAMSLDDVSIFLRGLKEIAWTNRGIVRVIEQKRDAKTVKVELLDSTSGELGVVRDLPLEEVKRFFSGVELRNTKQTQAGSSTAKVVDFEVSMRANDII